MGILPEVAQPGREAVEPGAQPLLTSSKMTQGNIGTNLILDWLLSTGGKLVEKWRVLSKRE